MLNTDLARLDVEAIKSEEQGKKSKLLWAAYETAMNDYPLKYYKDLLTDYENAVRADQQAAEQAELEKEEKAKAKAERAEKAAKRKSKGAETDVEMEDGADAANR
ncbi:hypothetical protein MRB53_036905 [Persea americana]|nr:hypothetical protein MRB53_036905 [Persea americana]